MLAKSKTVKEVKMSRGHWIAECDEKYDVLELNPSCGIRISH